VITTINWLHNIPNFSTKWFTNTKTNLNIHNYVQKENKETKRQRKRERRVGTIITG